MAHERPAWQKNVRRAGGVDGGLPRFRTAIGHRLVGAAAVHPVADLTAKKVPAGRSYGRLYHPEQERSTSVLPTFHVTLGRNDVHEVTADSIMVIIAIVFVTVSCERLVRGPKLTNRDSPAVRSRNNHYQASAAAAATSS
jgi:hypothetical protein